MVAKRCIRRSSNSTVIMPQRGTAGMAGSVRAAALIDSRKASMDATPRTCASRRSRACLRASASSADMWAGAGGRGGSDILEAFFICGDRIA